jgi:hypothetical protein
MGISIDPVVGKGIVFDCNDQNYESNVIEFIKHIDPNFSMDDYDEDSLEIAVYEKFEGDLEMEWVGNCVTGKDQRIFIKIVSDKGEKSLIEFGQPIIEVNDVCIM